MRGFNLKVLIFLCLLILLAPTFAKSVDFKIIKDTEGRTIKIPMKVDRVVVLTATCIETIYILGAIDKVVGISRNIIDNPFYIEVIKDLKEIPIVAQSLRDIDLEKILALRPDLIIGIGPEHPFGMSKEMVKKIEHLGIPIILLNLENLDENYLSIELLGEIFNRRDKAKELIEFMKKIQKEIESKVKGIPNIRKIKALMLSQKPTMVLGGYWGQQDLISLAGGTNVAAELREFVGEVSMEKIVYWNPDVITIVGTAPYEPKDLILNPQWRHINAIKNGKVYKYPYHLTGLFTPRVVLLLAWHASKFYPELRINWYKMADEFFIKFYGIKYSGPRE